jgi:hypothetical protein
LECCGTIVAATPPVLEFTVVVQVKRRAHAVKAGSSKIYAQGVINSLSSGTVPIVIIDRHRFFIVFSDAKKKPVQVVHAVSKHTVQASTAWPPFFNPCYECSSGQDIARVESHQRMRE